MTKIKLLFKSLLLSFFLFLGSTVLASSVSAAKLYLSPSEKSIVKSTEFEVNLVIDTEGTQVFGAEAKINYSSSDLELKSVTNGNFFTDFSSPTSSGLIEIRGYLSSMYDTRSGNGNLAVLKFLAKKDSGSAIISFDCGGTQILDNNGVNVLSCGTLNQSNITFTSESTGGTDTTTQSDPNSCGGTCGSNYNCKSEYFCYMGYCKNPACPSDSDCVCPTTTTKTPFPKPQALTSTKSTLSPTPQIVTIKEVSAETPITINETPIPEEEISKEEVTKPNPVKYIALAVLGAGIIFAIIKVLLKSKKTNIPPFQSSPNEPITYSPPPVFPEQKSPNTPSEPQNPPPQVG